jgi:endosialidase-like protein
VKTLFAIAGFALSVVLIAGAGFALPRALSVERSPAVERVGFGCNFINGKLVCGKSESSDDADDDSGDHQKKKAKDTDSELTECTIQQGPGGGGCVKGFKHVCQKLKSGKKCCGCVPDKNAQAPANAPETPKVDQASCAKEGLQYIAGGGDKCYCPNGLVNKATGLLVATHRSDCVTAESYNQLDSGDKVSDIRLKADIRRVGTTALNLPLYTFRYIGKDGQYEGVMAQDVLKVMPKAVSVGEDGYYRVNYDMLGIKMRRLD